MFQMIFLSIIRSLKLHIQRQAFVRLLLHPAASIRVQGAPECGCVMHTHIQAHSQQRTLTQYGMLPQHPVNIRKLISECF